MSKKKTIEADSKKLTNSTAPQHNFRGGRIFNRITLITVLGVFTLLVVAMLITTGVMSLIARNWNVEENNVIVFGVTILAISLAVGIALSVAYSAIIVRATSPYIEALQKFADCDFSVQIEDKSILSGLGVAENFNNTARQLASVETLREDFVSNFSHEFKTPIVSISGFAKLLKNPNLTQEERNEYLDVIIDESNRLVTLSQSVLLLTRLDSQTLNYEQFLLDEQLRQSILLFDKAAENKNIEISADLQEISVVSEKKILNQVWINLLSNAIKFTPNGGKVEVNSTCVDNIVTVTVKDNGCGMDEETLQNIFNKFYQGDKSHSTEGNGLGLSVVKKICDLLHMRIYVTSAVNEGSTFTVTFDRGAPTNSDAATVAAQPDEQ